MKYEWHLTFRATEIPMQGTLDTITMRECPMPLIIGQGVSIPTEHPQRQCSYYGPRVRTVEYNIDRAYCHVCLDILLHTDDRNIFIAMMRSYIRCKELPWHINGMDEWLHDRLVATGDNNFEYNYQVQKEVLPQ